MQSNISFESVIIGNIELCDETPSESEQPLKTLLEMAKNWLFSRAQHKVSLIPGNYMAGLLQLDAQDIGEISHNLTYNFCHREETLLPELKKLLSFLWRSRLHLLEPFRRKVDDGDPYLVAHQRRQNSAEGSNINSQNFPLKNCHYEKKLDWSSLGAIVTMKF
jgi:hypothetical protein